MVHKNDFPDMMKACVQTINDPLLMEKGLTINTLRLDKIHTIISGNKWFKLKYYLEAAVSQRKKGILTFGGAYSNHLVATAYACKLAGLSSLGMIRGEEPAAYSPTLNELQSYGMKLQFVSREAYRDDDLVFQLQLHHPDFLIVPEGGHGQPGIRGAEEILHLISPHHYTHIICAVGTGTMLTGILHAAGPHQEVLGIMSLKINQNPNAIVDYIRKYSASTHFTIHYNFHFGGYAKRNEELIQFMNKLYDEQGIPTDFVYTGKLFYAAYKLSEQNYFNPGSNVLVIHSGGLQGNRSLPQGILHFKHGD